jgi:hypothetical protein
VQVPGPTTWFTAELPAISRPQARRLVVSIGAFWGCIAVGIPAIKQPGGVVLILGALPAGFIFYSTLYKIWGTRSFVLPRRGMSREVGKQYTAMFSLFRPSFIRQVFRATGWPPVVVALVLVALLGAAVVSGSFLAPPDQPICDARQC